MERTYKNTFNNIISEGAFCHSVYTITPTIYVYVTTSQWTISAYVLYLMYVGVNRIGAREIRLSLGKNWEPLTTFFFRRCCFKWKAFTQCQPRNALYDAVLNEAFSLILFAFKISSSNFISLQFPVFALRVVYWFARELRYISCFNINCKYIYEYWSVYNSHNNKNIFF